jgi:catechol 2,3-dioxygenase-like lactoylglutathione lyase family enzyme
VADDLNSDVAARVGQIHHLVVNVRDMDVSLPFYRDVLGLNYDGTTEVGGPVIGRLARIPPDSHGRNAFLSAGHGMGRVELVEWTGVDEQWPDDPPRRTGASPGYALMSFLVSDASVDVLHARARRDSVCWSEVLEFVVAGTTVRAFVVEDPDGNPVEIFSLPS